MKKNKTPPGINVSIGRDLAYIIALPKALNALSQKKRRKQKSQSSNIYEDLLCLKNSLDALFITSHKKNSEEYKQQLYRKILVEKLLLNIAAGKNSEIKQSLEDIMKEEGLTFVEREESLIPQEEKFLIRTEFHGLSHYPSKELLSPYFNNFLENTPEDKTQKYKSNEYNLHSIPSWKYFTQFSYFQKKSIHFCKALAEMKIPPQDISQLNAYDLITVLKRYNQKHNIPNFETAKSNFIKYFIRNHEADFRAYLQENQQVIRYALHQKGICFDDQKHSHSYDKFIDTTIEQMKNKGTVPPLFNIHHKRPVKDSQNTENLSTANDPKNLCLIIQYPYHEMLHLFDTNLLGKTIFNRKVKRVMLPQGLIFFGGFSRKFQFYHQQHESEYSKLLAQVLNQQKKKHR